MSSRAVPAPSFIHPFTAFWFHMFMVGIHTRVGEIKWQDEALSIDVLREIDKILETNWRRTTDTQMRRKVAEMGVWFTGGFCTRLRCKEAKRWFTSNSQERQTVSKNG
jgi:hypothetical protein